MPDDAVARVEVDVVAGLEDCCCLHLLPGRRSRAPCFLFSWGQWTPFIRLESSAGVVSLTSQDHASSSKHVTIVSDEMKMHARKLGLGFASRNIVSGVVRCLTRKNGANDIKRLAVQALRMMAFSGEEFTKSWTLKTSWAPLRGGC